MKKFLLILGLFLILSCTGCNPLADSVFHTEPAKPELTEEEKAAIRREEQLIPLLQEASRLALGYYYE